MIEFCFCMEIKVQPNQIRLVIAALAIELTISGQLCIPRQLLLPPVLDPDVLCGNRHAHAAAAESGVIMSDWSCKDRLVRLSETLLLTRLLRRVTLRQHLC